MSVQAPEWSGANIEETFITKASKKKSWATAQKPSTATSVKKMLAAATKASASKPKPNAAPAAQSRTKQGILINLLQGSKGATVDEMVEATGWQRHSVQGVMSGVLKKKLGLIITSDKEQRGRVYRIDGAGK